MTPGADTGPGAAGAWAGWASLVKILAALVLVAWATRGRRLVLVGGLALGLGAGCGINRATLERDILDPKSGAVVARERMRINLVTTWPASQSLDKQRASLGKTLSFGQAAVDQDGGGTNLADTIRATTDFLRAIQP